MGFVEDFGPCGMDKWSYVPNEFRQGKAELCTLRFTSLLQHLPVAASGFQIQLFQNTFSSNEKGYDLKIEKNAKYSSLPIS